MNTDLFERDKTAQKISDIVTTQEECSPLAIDGNWGTGKTDLCQRITQRINNDSSHTTQALYINTFEHDQSESPLLSLLAELTKILPESEDPNLWNSMREALKTSSGIIAKAALHHIFRIDADEAQSDFEESLEKQGEAYLNKQIDKLLEVEAKKANNLAMLKAALIKATANQTLIFVIDELDRCAPSYAIKLLEQTKHVFDVPNIRFILSANITQLESNFINLYGNSSGASYTEKFINFTIPLRTKSFVTNRRQSINNNSKYLLEIVGENYSSPALVNVIDYLTKTVRINLRDIEKLGRSIRYLVSNNSEFDLERDNFPFIALSAFLATRYPEIATALLHKDADYESKYFKRFSIDCHEEVGHYDSDIEYNYLAIKDWTPFACLTYIALEGYKNKAKLGLDDPERCTTAEEAIIKIIGRGHTFKNAHYAFTKVCEKLIF
ncbi:KAP family P-loop NTPase fold protein [Marinomonas balearica]|uniref:KAP family P-loop NTPase fold protein n=1 Tax=Marinomonas balearica TaxID=491947 RepID=UPI001414DBA8|nr:P-loop NTPase fold protein [Marinomonas balearica]